MLWQVTADKIYKDYFSLVQTIGYEQPLPGSGVSVHLTVFLLRVWLYISAIHYKGTKVLFYLQ